MAPACGENKVRAIIEWVIIFLIITVVMQTVGCTPKVEEPPPNALDSWRSKLRHQYFLECLKAAPQGPVSAKYNDWDEAIAACDNAAYYQSVLALPDNFDKPDEGDGSHVTDKHHSSPFDLEDSMRRRPGGSTPPDEVKAQEPTFGGASASHGNPRRPDVALIIPATTKGDL